MTGDPVVLLKPADVAARLSVSRSWIYDAAADGRIPSIRLGGPDGPLRFLADDVEAWIMGARTPGRSGAGCSSPGSS